MAFSPDGKRIVSGSKNTVKVWDADKGQMVRTLKGDITSNGCCTTSAAWGLAPMANASSPRSEKGRIRSWDAIKGQEVTPCTDPPPPDGQREAVSPDGKLRIWADRTVDQSTPVRSD